MNSHPAEGTGEIRTMSERRVRQSNLRAIRRRVASGLLASCLLFASASLGDTGMSPRVVQLPGFTVVGISARTSNAKEMTAEGVIGKQWSRLLQEQLIDRIPNKADQSVVAVYTEYASDHHGEYTYVLGAKVTSDANLPAGMLAKKIPSGKYAVFTTEKGPAAKVVSATWMRINSLPKLAEGGDRIYQADFEVYDQRAVDPQNLQADVYVGIR
jgi:predicted transcriptional regulator YdeE